MMLIGGRQCGRSALIAAALFTLGQLATAAELEKVIVVDEGPSLNEWLTADDYDDGISDWKFIIRKSEMRTYSLTEQFDKALVKPVRNPSNGLHAATLVAVASVAKAHPCGGWGTGQDETTF